MAEEYTPTTGTTKAATARSGAAPGGSSPDEELKKLNEAQEKDKAEADKLKKQMDERKTKLESLAKALADTSQVSTAYDAAVKGVSADRLEIQDFIANELPQLEKQDEVKSKKAEIEGIIKQANTKLETKDAERLKLEQKYKDEKTALQTANDELAGKKAERDELQNLQRTVQDKFNVLRKILQGIKTQGANKPLVKYVLGLELKTVWDETTPLFKSKEQLQTSYYAKAEEVRTATAAVAAHEEKYKLAQAALETARKELDAMKTGRLEGIVKDVGALVPSAPAGTAAGAGAGVGAGAAATAAASPA